MNFKKLVLDFYRVLRNLPNYGKVLALASVATLYVAIHPTVTEPKAIHRHYNSVNTRIYRICIEDSGVRITEDKKVLNILKAQSCHQY